uniref:Rx N-terminal domain-containing protein n=1 Tax=Fagus sylvatica TaxID=28930 RepID=A0A2N9HKV5_FAGSY
MLNKLENACLLEGGIEEYDEEKFVKMHDLVRDMVLRVASPQFKVEGHLGLEDFSDEGKWREDLVKASLMYNNISRIPPNASPMCPKLSTLLLQGNESLKDVPDSLFEHLHGLNILDLSYTGIESLPNSVSNLENLTTLRLRRVLVVKACAFISKAYKIKEVASLKNLETFGGRFSDMYEFSTYMEKGQLATYEIHVGSIRDLAGSMRGKKELSLEGLGLSAVPSEVWESGEVIKVNLSRNAIQELPVELSSCISLQTLVLSRNKIKDWPGAILKSLPNLSCLKLDNNPLGQIPADGFQAVSRVQVLDLSGNAASLPEHPVFSSIPHLQELYLRRIQLHEVPSDIFSLQQLRILDLSQNSLQSVPVEFQHLTSLTELDLSDNNIAVLPPELGLLEPNLQALRLDGNPLRSLQLPTRKRALT